MNNVTPSTNNKPILIAHVIHRLQVGGLENGLVNIINRLPEDRLRHAIICLTESTDFAERIIPKVEIIELHKQEGKDLGLYWRLYKAMRQLRPDIVHTRNLGALEAQVAAWLAGVRYRIHGLHGWDVHDLTGANPRYLKLYRMLDRLIHRYVPLSDDLENYLIERVGVDSGKIIKICNGVDTERFCPSDDKTALRERLLGHFVSRHDSLESLPVNSSEASQSQKDFEHVIASEARQSLNDMLIVGTVGRLEVVKDQTNLVQAFILLLQDNPHLKENVRLMLVGDGALRQQIEQMLSDAQLSEYVWLTGARDDVPDLMRCMDLFVLPSKAEGISNTILEAMASGLPAIATNVGGNSQLIIEGETGSLVPKEDPDALADTISKYVKNKVLMAEQAASARQRALEQFSLQGMVDRYADLYGRLHRQSDAPIAGLINSEG